VDVRHVDLFADVMDAYVGKLWFVERFIDRLIFADAVQKVALCVFRVHVCVVWVARADLERNIGGDDCWIVAEGLDEDDLDTRFPLDALEDLIPPSLGAVGGV